MRLDCYLSSFLNSDNVIDYLPKPARDQGQQHDRVFEKRGSGVRLCLFRCQLHVCVVLGQPLSLPAPSSVDGNNDIAPGHGATRNIK